MSQSLEDFQQWFEQRNPNAPEFQQAVMEVARCIWPELEAHPRYHSFRVLERLTEPDRTISFRVCWEDDNGEVRVNRGYRVQLSNALGPYKGGLRFHPSVNESVLKFLAFEQTFKNALTGLPMGSGKGGADFDPHGKSDREIMRFCQAYMLELHRHLGADVDIPAGDINVGPKEIGYLKGAFQRIKNNTGSVLTGKPPSSGGSELRLEATGYGLVLFVVNMLERIDDHLQDKKVVISGAGNVALHAADKVRTLGGKVVALSDSHGTLTCEAGFTADDLDAIHELKSGRHSLESFMNNDQAKWHKNEQPWSVPCDIALPCATQNELDESSANKLLDNGCWLVAEGANMPCTDKAQRLFQDKGILYAPGKASNAGGVAISGLEITQNRMGMSYQRDHLEQRLEEIMRRIHQQCVEFGQEHEHIDYVKGANIAGFKRVAETLVSFGIT
ncbi:Glutamate dehydrogenase (NADP(+)) [Saliniradius amylolyticus]|uniref:Glutamate dehydrogenase n=1 Tax=Saliniradius amylolyticus TaxID=2183582 RepID=A0A2S2E0L4_9ALTE|nr:NADP-specific glutamate dehydrogenase [Saliniradius amylolyticus]AWL11191.1 Glutamate dehydrogenase (NADP(+)) [Saliniradius amylolyticus]